ncbi:hypothetical protein CLIB1444_07S07338 [[Candida] jaroonii]|uniref:Uncharacterized protein n=1 Tax=[Candida] jaroonii TaxID=467808 RepID=A0ACA9YAB6_9ASCO|nr:hypothetical protein CLIB1444_07S07338 [[Candida] jaroonii]
MSFLISTPYNGIKVLDLHDYSMSKEFLRGSGSIDKIIHFENDTRYLIIVRGNIIELYKWTREFKLIKQWRNNVMNDKDKLLDVGIIENQYLYSCSVNGEFKFRDLINDDISSSYKSTILNSPIECLKVTRNLDFRILHGGKNNKVRCVSLDEPPKIFNPKEFNIPRFKNLNVEWTRSVEIWNDYTITGNQWGQIKIVKDEREEKFKISDFPITALHIHKNLLIFNDLIFKIGIINLKTMKLINQFTFDGPIKQSLVYYRSGPIYFIYTTFDNKFKVLKLFNNNKTKLVHDIQFDFDLCFELLKWH